jgi:hypothetical protein
MSKKEIKITCINKPSDEKLRNYYYSYLKMIKDKFGIEFLKSVQRELTKD